MCFAMKQFHLSFPAFDYCGNDDALYFPVLLDQLRGAKET
jgi:hypothetical protein